MAKRCGKCKNCLVVEKAKTMMLRTRVTGMTRASGTQVGKRYAHQVVTEIAGANDDMVALWNEILRDNPCLEEQ